MQGCQQINQGSSDGSNLLPLDMVAGLAHCRELSPDIKFSNFTFHSEVEGFSVPPLKLMRLRHDKLRNTKQDQGIESKLIQEIQENVTLEADVVIPVTRVWCQYPPGPSKSQSPRMMHSKKSLQDLVKGLPLLFGLFSGDLRNPLPSNALQVVKPS